MLSFRLLAFLTIHFLSLGSAGPKRLFLVSMHSLSMHVAFVLFHFQLIKNCIYFLWSSIIYRLFGARCLLMSRSTSRRGCAWLTSARCKWFALEVLLLEGTLCVWAVGHLVLGFTVLSAWARILVTIFCWCWMGFCPKRVCFPVHAHYFRYTCTPPL